MFERSKPQHQRKNSVGEISVASLPDGQERLDARRRTNKTGRGVMALLSRLHISHARQGGETAPVPPAATPENSDIFATDKRYIEAHTAPAVIDVDTVHAIHANEDGRHANLSVERHDPSHTPRHAKAEELPALGTPEWHAEQSAAGTAEVPYDAEQNPDVIGSRAWQNEHDAVPSVQPEAASGRHLEVVGSEQWYARQQAAFLKLAEQHHAQAQPEINPPDHTEEPPLPTPGRQQYVGRHRRDAA